MTAPDPSPSIQTRTAWSIATRLAVVVLLLAHWLMAVSSVREKSTTFDEVAHLTAGVSVWRTGDYRLVPEHPPLAHLWAAAPVAASGARFPRLDQPGWRCSDQWNLGRQLFYECGNDPQVMLTRGRAMIALMSVALGAAVWLWSRRLFGESGGIISLALYVFSPTMLAHGRLITTDLSAALFFLIAVGVFWRMLHRISLITVMLGALATAALLLSKMSAVLILPIAGVLVVIRLVVNRPTTVAWPFGCEVRSRPGQLGAWFLAGLTQGLIIVFLIWAAYGFQFAAMRDAQPGRDRFYVSADLPARTSAWDYMLDGLGHTGPVLSWARDRALLPEAYLFGLASTLKHAQARPAFLNGRTRLHGWWYFFPYCFLVKTPLPLLGVLLMAAAPLGIWIGPRRTERPTGPRWRSVFDGLYRTAPLWTLFVIYWCFAMGSELNIGHRHVLPVYPVLFVLAGRASIWIRSPRRPVRLVVPAMVGLLAAASLMTWPHYLTYFNVLAGGARHAYKHLVDSSLDWGQDLPGLKRWLDRHHTPEARAGGDAAPPPVYLSYFGMGLPKHYGIRARALPSYGLWSTEPLWTSRLTGGVYCISATTLQQVRLLPECRWTRPLEADYQGLGRMLVLAARRLRANPGMAAASVGMTEANVRTFQMLQFGRLCAALRQRTPDDAVGHTILIYRLSDQDVRRALDGPPAELLPGEAGDRR